MHISKKQFYIITLLFLLLPFSVQWRLLIFGAKTTGIVVKHEYSGNSLSRHSYSIIQFQANNSLIEFSSPEDLNYPIGKEIKIIYNTKKPSQYVMLNFAGLFISNKLIIPGVLLIMWFAFYLTLIQISQNRN